MDTLDNIMGMMRENQAARKESSGFGEKVGAKIAEKILWEISSRSPAMEIDPIARAELVAELRQMANIIELHPEQVVGMVFVTGTREIHDGHTDIHVKCHSVGSDHSLAATSLMLKDSTEQALKKTLPDLINVALSSDTETLMRFL